MQPKHMGFVCIDVYIDQKDNIAPVIIPIHWIKQIAMAMKQSEIIEMPVRAQGVAIIVMMNGEQVATPHTMEELAEHLGTVMISDCKYKEAGVIDVAPKVVSH
jgi:hypothetical protein